MEFEVQWKLYSWIGQLGQVKMYGRGSEKSDMGSSCTRLARSYWFRYKAPFLLDREDTEWAQFRLDKIYWPPNDSASNRSILRHQPLKLATNTSQAGSSTKRRVVCYICDIVVFRLFWYIVIFIKQDIYY